MYCGTLWVKAGAGTGAGARAPGCWICGHVDAAYGSGVFTLNSQDEVDYAHTVSCVEHFYDFW